MGKQRYFFNQQTKKTPEKQIKPTKDTNIEPEPKVSMHGDVILLPLFLT